jgi:diguanylate cyclase (GGDEF)-like protein
MVVNGGWVRRRSTVLLGILLATSSVAAVTGSIRQTMITQHIAAGGYESQLLGDAAYRSLREMELIRAVMSNPDGEERRELLGAYAQATAAIAAAARINDEHHAALELIATRQQTLSRAIREYLTDLDQHRHDAARSLLDNLIEPTAGTVTATLQTVKTGHLAEHNRRQADAERDSRELTGASILIFLVGVLTLAAFARSSRRHRRQIDALTSTDLLTGLPNRAAFTNRVRDQLSAGTPATVLIVNLDGFRDVNDQFGHEIGDRLLAAAGQRIAATVGAHDTVARLGCDEFAVLLSPHAAPGMADWLTRTLQQPYALGELTVDLEVSIGAATSRGDEAAAALLNHADRAMHTAKTQRLGFREFDADHVHDTAARLRLLGDLRRALDSTEQLTLHYQPKINLATGAIAGVEALARWHHPDRGPVSPAEFILVLESTSLIHTFTDQILSIALRQARAWRSAGHPIRVAVNVSTRTLLDPGFIDRLVDLLTTHEVPGDQLCIEITEYTVMADPDTAITTLHRIRALGVRISIDDYGTGYSSMAYLKSLPVDELKIDRAFVTDMTTDPALVASTIELGHNLGLTVTAEGVEDDATRAALVAAGCDLAQGYFFARPQPAHHISQFLHLATVEGGR